MNRPGIFLALCLICLVNGCSKGEEALPLKKTVKVSGIVTVNGQVPPWKIQISAVPESGMDEIQPTVSSAETQDDGTFEFSTYALGDGVPEGKYVLVAKSQATAAVFLKGSEPPDKLAGKYGTPSKSPKKFEVPAGSTEPIDLGTIDLKANVKKK